MTNPCQMYKTHGPALEPVNALTDASVYRKVQNIDVKNKNEGLHFQVSPEKHEGAAV